jgi:hypothetical protein
MRFSSIFQLPLPQRLAVEQEAPARVEEIRPAYTAPESLPRPDFSQLPEDLDQRVRLVGEWQMSDF